MTWRTPVLREIMADGAATAHKERFFTNGATPNMIVKMDKEIKWDAASKWADQFREQHEGPANAYKTLFLGGGADAEVVGANFQQLEFKSTQGAGETRIAAAAGVPPIIVGLSEGLEAATYSNYGQARRRFADGTMRPLWRNMAGSLQTILPPPQGTRLWYDDRDIPFLQEDEKDAADIVQVQAGAIRTLTDGGYTPESVIQAVTSGDLSFLEHTGLVPVQVQPGSVSANGDGDTDAVPAPAQT
jgi:phage portal protein BeeE